MWGAWSGCSRECGATQSRVKNCDAPLPKNGGRSCFGIPYETQTCSLPSCVGKRCLNVIRTDLLTFLLQLEDLRIPARASTALSCVLLACHSRPGSAYLPFRPSTAIFCRACLPYDRRWVLGNLIGLGQNVLTV